MSGQEEFEKYLHKYYVRTDELINDYRTSRPKDYGQILHSWQACAEKKDAIIEQQAAEIEALREFANFALSECDELGTLTYKAVALGLYEEDGFTKTPLLAGICPSKASNAK